MESSYQNLSQTISKYQEIYTQDPESKIFAVLADAYRQRKYLEQAYSIASKGVASHPRFPAGHLILARILMSQNQYSTAIKHFKRTTELAPDNLMAHRLLGECYLQLRRTEDAIRTYRMVLCLNPLDHYSKNMLKKLEHAIPSEFLIPQHLKTSESIEKVESIAQTIESQLKKPFFQRTLNYELERYISLIDAFSARNDYKKAIETVDEAFARVGPTPELKRRRTFLNQRFNSSASDLTPQDDGKIKKKIEILKRLLDRIEKRKIYPLKNSN